jgi:hypothetical protein
MAFVLDLVKVHGLWQPLEKTMSDDKNKPKPEETRAETLRVG